MERDAEVCVVLCCLSEGEDSSTLVFVSGASAGPGPSAVAPLSSFPYS